MRGADYFAYNIRKDGHETKFSVRSKDGEEDYVLTMPGLFNVENAVAVIAAAKILGIPGHCIHSGLKKARSSGRMELYASKDKKNHCHRGLCP